MLSRLHRGLAILEVCRVYKLDCGVHRLSAYSVGLQKYKYAAREGVRSK